MSLPEFLRGTRPNPSTRATFRLRHRHAEGGPWTEVAEAGSAPGLDEEITAGWRGWPSSLGADAFDVARTFGPSGVRLGTLALDPDGSLQPLGDARVSWDADTACQSWMAGTDEEERSVPHDWPGAWDVCSRGDWMLWAVRTLPDRGPLVRVAATAAARILTAVPRDWRAPAEDVLRRTATWRAPDPDLERLAGALQGEGDRRWEALGDGGPGPVIRSLLAMATLARCGDTVGAASDVVARSETVLSLLESKAAGRAMRQDVADALRRELPFADVVAWRLAVGVRR